MSKTQPFTAQSHALQRLEDGRLPNAMRIHPKVICGGQPDQAGMRALNQLGVKTLISVDGAQPDVTLAREYKLKYVHIPLSFSGIPDERIKELAKAVRDLDGIIYIHCHDGKHRGPAAAATACIAAGLITHENGLAVLKAAGTNVTYRGLFHAVEDALPLKADQLDELSVEFRECVATQMMTQAMTGFQRALDELKKCDENRWQPTRESPDPAHLALLLREQYTEILRTDELQQKPREFQALMCEGEELAQKLENAIRAFRQSDTAEVPPSVSVSFAAVGRNCKRCHQRYRDPPLRVAPGDD